MQSEGTGPHLGEASDSATQETRWVEIPASPLSQATVGRGDDGGGARLPAGYEGGICGNDDNPGGGGGIGRQRRAIGSALDYTFPLPISFFSSFFSFCQVALGRRRQGSPAITGYVSLGGAENICASNNAALRVAFSRMEIKDYTYRALLVAVLKVSSRQKGII